MMGKKYKGFSLIEILVVVALIVILATITIVAINPAKNFRDTRNAQRSADIMQILNAVTQYTSEQGHTLGQLGEIDVCPEVTELGTGEGQLNLGDDPEATPAIDGPLVDEYIVAIPEDPKASEGAVYTICQTDSGRIELSAEAEISATETETITVKR